MHEPLLQSLMARIEARYPVETVEVSVSGTPLRIVRVRDIEEYLADFVDRNDAGPVEVPFWAQLWEGARVLAEFLGEIPADPGRRILEIGAGLGLSGVCAAMRGHRVTITDVNEDALLFARVNALLNGVPEVEVRRLDWRAPDLPHRYDMIAGSEVIYDRRSYPALVAFLRRALAPGGVVHIVKHVPLATPSFFAELNRAFTCEQRIRTLAGSPDDFALYTIRPLPEVP